MNLKKSILIISEASEKIGFGHLSRSIELYKEFTKKSNLEIFFLISLEYTQLKKILKQRNIDISNNFLCFEDWNYKKITDLLKQYNFSCVVFDLQNEHKPLRNYFINRNNKTISLDFFFNNNQPDIAINLFNHKTLDSELHGKKNMLIKSGPEFAIIRDEFKRVRNLKFSKQKNSQIKNILIVMGGADPNSNSIKAIRGINKYKNESIGQFPKINIIIGPLFSDKLRKRIFEYSKIDKNIKIFESPQNLSDFFLENDLIFCGGGTTLLESMSSGLPAVVVPQSNEESNHGNFYSKLGACIMFKDFLDPAFNLFDSSFFESIKKNALNTVDQKGKRRILNIALGLINE